MLIQAVDGLLYENPIVHEGSSDFYFCVPDMEMPRIVVIRKSKRMTHASARRVATRGFKVLGLKGHVWMGYPLGVTCDNEMELPGNDVGVIDKTLGLEKYLLPPDLVRLTWGYAFGVDLTGPIPVPPSQLGCYKYKTDYPGDFCTNFMAWTLPFSVAKLREFVAGETNHLLEHWLSGGHLIKRVAAVHAIKRQCPDIDSLPDDSIIKLNRC